MIEQHELKRRLRRLQRALSVVPCINYGGCGVMAAITGGTLRKLGVEAEVVTIGNCLYEDFGGRAAAHIRSNVYDNTDPHEWDDNGLDRGHLAVRFKLGGRVHTWDSDAMYRTGRYFGENKYPSAGKFGEGLTIEEAKAITKTGAGWNSTFNRRHIPMLRHLVKHHLELGLQ